MDADVEDLLRGVPLFADCRGAELTRVGAVMREVRLRPGEVMTLGPGSDVLYVVAAGDAEASGAPPRGLGRGDSFGEEELLGDPGVPRTVRATSELRLLAMDGRALFMLLDCSPAAARSMLRGLLRRVRAPG